MPQISQAKKNKIAEQILAYLFTNSPNPKFTSDIAKELARDEEFTKKLLQELAEKSILTKITKNPKGLSYLKRQRWSLTSKAYEAYKKHQN